MLIFFKKLKIFSGEISWNNTHSDWAVKWLSLISIRSKQVSKIILQCVLDVMNLKKIKKIQ